MADDGYPNSTLYRPPTQFDTGAMTRAADELPSLTQMVTSPSTARTDAQNAARTAAAKKATAVGGDFYGYGTPPAAGAGEGGVGLQRRGYALPQLTPGYGNANDMQGDASQLVHTPGLVPGATMSNVDGVNGAQKIVDAQGRTTYTNLGAGGYVSPSKQLPSVPGFLSGVRDLYARGASGTTTGGAAAPRYSYSKGINGDLIREEASAPKDVGDRANDMFERADALEKQGSVARAIGLRKRASALVGLQTGQGQLGVQQGQLDVNKGHLGIAAGQLGVQQGQLGLQQQSAYANNQTHLSALQLLDPSRQGGPNVPAAIELLQAMQGHNANAPTFTPGLPTGGVLTTPSGSAGTLTLGKTGGYDYTRLPSLQQP